MQSIYLSSSSIWTSTDTAWLYHR